MKHITPYLIPIFMLIFTFGVSAQDPLTIGEEITAIGEGVTADEYQFIPVAGTAYSIELTSDEFIPVLLLY